jgi:D-alanyl-D-alanine carboxypeptidase (penicillin-binding protein 5/6)
MLDYGFANFETVLIAEKGQIMTDVLVERGTPDHVGAAAVQKITALIPKGQTDSISTKINIEEIVPLPLKTGQNIGWISVWENDEKLAEYPLAAASDIEKASFRELISRAVHNVLQ